ncbi:uncharacterized protein LOC129231663 [Uloborus diversus]|uniref:uncharacterized protein LOC129231663 n=1 Tax=Uloborus diversus TaxID=327109 RepID=UPI00240A923E|nr:uncharacterized protein LOC129231663 [Uloborus diversus]
MPKAKSQRVGRPIPVWTVHPLLSRTTTQENLNTGVDNPMYYDSESGLCSKQDVCKKKHDTWSDTESYTEKENGGRVHLLLVSICILLLILIGMIITVIYLAIGEVRLSSMDVDDDFQDDEGISLVEGRIRITNRLYKVQFKDERTEEFRKLSSEIIQSMDAIFLHSLQHYNRTTVLSFDEGSVIAKCQIHFTQPRKDATHKIGMTVIEALERYHGYLPGGMLQVDIRSLCFTGLPNVIDPVLSDAVKLPSKSGLPDVIDPALSEVVELPSTWGAWSEWSICAAPCEMQTRYRKCIDISTPCAGKEREVRSCPCDVKDDLFTNNATSVIMECNGDCAIGHICIFLYQTPYARCLVPRDVNDPSGCGGWCLGHHQLCKNLGNATFQCAIVPPCKDGEWQCSNGLCIPITDICNGHEDCLDMSDELNCNCGSGYFRCGNNTPCLPDKFKCDGKVDCWDANDELNCTKSCPTNEFNCNNGMCVGLDLFCDRYPDCSDGTDEPDGCGDPCLSTQKECNNGRCIYSEFWCDGVDDCKDGSDEKDCSSTSSPLKKQP